MRLQDSENQLPANTFNYNIIVLTLFKLNIRLQDSENQLPASTFNYNIIMLTLFNATARNVRNNANMG